MAKQSRNEPEKRQYNLDYGFNAELEWFFNASGTELGEHGSAWRELVSGISVNTESSDLVVGWGKCLISSPEKYRRVMAAFRRLPVFTLETLAARYSPITPQSIKLEEAKNRALWHSQLGELQWVAVALAIELDREESARIEKAHAAWVTEQAKRRADAIQLGQPESIDEPEPEPSKPDHLAKLFRDVELGLANKSKQKGHRSWLAKAEDASRTAHADFLRARMSDDIYRRQVVGEVDWRPTSPEQLAATPYPELLKAWDRELHPTPVSQPEQTHQRIPRSKQVARKSRNIQIESGVEWALA